MNSVLLLIKYRPFLIAAMVIVPIFFFIGGPEHYSPRSIIHVWNLGHVVYFAFLPLAVITCLNLEKLKTWNQISIAFGLAVVFGTLMEFFQSSFGRTFDPYDLMRNGIGAMVGISFICPVKRIIPRSIKMLTVALVASQLYPIAVALTDEYHMRRDFPILSDFETPFQIHRWGGSAAINMAKDIGFSNNRALKAVLPTTQYPGVYMKYFQRDWHRYKRFQFKVFNPSAVPQSLTCRIHDEAHSQGIQLYEDRYNRAFNINPGWNTISIDLKDIGMAPRDRLMDLTRIRGVAIFAINPSEPLTIYLDDLKLF